MNKTLAERAEEAYLREEDFKRRRDFTKRQDDRKEAVSYFSMILREATFYPEKDRFILEDEEFDYAVDEEATYLRGREMSGVNYAYKVCKLIGKLGSFNDLAGYGGYLRKQKEVELDRAILKAANLCL